MADERDFELLDDFLGNRMNEQDRAAFEQRLNADPDLQHEYALQKRVIQGIKEARMSELKSMLNKVPVPSAGTGNALTSKIVLGTAMTLIIAAAAYWFVQDEEPPQATEQKAPTEHHIPAEKPALPNAEPQRQKQKQQTAPADKRPVETDKNQTSAGTEHSKPSLAKRPDPLSAPAAKGNDSSGNNLDARNSGKDSSNLNGELSPQIKPLAPVTDSTLDRKLTPAGKPE